MALVKPASFRMESIARDMGPGDLIDPSENPLTVIDSAVGVTYTAIQLIPAEIQRTGAAGGGISDGLPTAAAIIAALSGNKNILSPPNNELWGLQPNRSVTLQWPALLDLIAPGSSFRRFIRNETGQILTITTSGTEGITLIGTMTIAAAKWREFLFRILGSAPPALLPVTTTSGNKILSAVNLDLINQITPGMSVYGTGIGAAAKVVAVDRDGGRIYVDVNSTATASLIAVTFTPTITVQNLRAGDL